MDITIKQLGKDDVNHFACLLQLFETAFEMKSCQKPDEHYLRELLARENFVVLAGMHQGIVVGGLTAHILPSYYTETSEAYIYDLAVDAGYRRQGVARKLIDAMATYCKAHHLDGFFVQADEADTHALHFYQATGGTPQKVVHYSYPLSAANEHI